MCSAGPPPPPPDYVGAAQQQGQANIDAARVQGRINNPNVRGPYGSQTVTWDGDTPTVDQQLSPQELAIYQQSAANRLGLGGLANQGLGALQGLIGTQFDMSGMPDAGQAYNGGQDLSGQALDPSSLGTMPSVYQRGNLPDMPQASSAIRQQVIDAMMQRQNAGFDRQQQQMQSDLIARGIRPGTEAYQREMDALGRQKNDAYSQAELTGGQEADRAFQQDLRRRQEGYTEGIQDSETSYRQGMGIRGARTQEQGQRFSQLGAAQELGQRGQAQRFDQQTQNRQRAIAEALMRRQTPLNEITALMSGSQVSNPFSMPGYSQNTSVAPAPIFGARDAAGRYGTDVYNAQVGSANSTNSAMGSLASTAIMAAMFY